MDVTYFGETTFRSQFRPFGSRQADRLSHFYVIGQTGVGKSALLELIARSDTRAGRGFALLDPHGDLAERLVAWVPPQHRMRLTYLDATDPTLPYGYNPLRRVRDDLIPLAASGLMESLRKLWPDAWGVRMEHVLRSSIYALLEQDNATLPDILRLYTDKSFRRMVVRRLKNPVVRAFWESEYPSYQPRYQAEMVAPIRNKLGALLSNPVLYRIFVAPAQEISFRRVMDEGGILIANLAKGRLGEDTATALGSILVSTLGLAAMSRADSETRTPFFLLVDEFQNFTTLAFVNQMAELRKYGVGLVLAHQHLAQLAPDVRSAVIANAGSRLAFRVGAEDASLFQRELGNRFEIEDLIGLPNRHFYARLMIDGTPSRPVSGRTIGIS